MCRSSWGAEIYLVWTKLKGVTALWSFACSYWQCDYFRSYLCSRPDEMSSRTVHAVSAQICRAFRDHMYMSENALVCACVCPRKMPRQDFCKYRPTVPTVTPPTHTHAQWGGALTCTKHRGSKKIISWSCLADGRCSKSPVQYNFNSTGNRAHTRTRARAYTEPFSPPLFARSGFSVSSTFCLCFFLRPSACFV